MASRAAWTRIDIFRVSCVNHKNNNNFGDSMNLRVGDMFDLMYQHPHVSTLIKDLVVTTQGRAC